MNKEKSKGWIIGNKYLQKKINLVKQISLTGWKKMYFRKILIKNQWNFGEKEVAYNF